MAESLISAADFPSRRILFIASFDLKKTIQASAVLHQILRQSVSPEVTIVASAASAPFFAAVPGVEKTVLITDRLYGVDWILAFKKLLSRKWDLVVDLNGTFFSRLLSARERKVLKRHRPLPSAFYGEPCSPVVWLAPEHRIGAEKRLFGEDNLIALAWRGAVPTGKEMKSIEVVVKRYEGATVLKVGFGDAPAVSVPGRKMIDMTGRLSLLSLGGCLEKCQAVVGNDDVILEMSRGLGVPFIWASP